MKPSYNDSFGQFDSGVSGGVISSGDSGGVAPANIDNSYGDVVIASSNGGRGGKRRWLIVVAVLLFLVAIGAGLGALLLGTKSKAGGNVKDSFDKFANYLMYGTDSTAQLEGEYERFHLYALHNALNNNDVNYFKTLDKYLDDYLSVMKNSTIDNADLAAANVGIFSAGDFIIPYGEKGILDTEELLKLVVEKNNLSDVEDYIKDYYSEYNVDGEDGSSAMQRYYDLIVSANSGEAEELFAYKEAGCIVDGEIEYDSCVLEKDLYETVVDYNEDYRLAQSYIDSSIRDILRCTWEANEAIKEWSNS